MVLTFIAGFGAVFGTAEGIRASQAKSRREEHRSRKNNLFVRCMKSTQYSNLLDGKQVVLSGHMCFIDTGMAHDTPYGHPFLGYYLPYPESKYSGLVSTITDEAPIMNWVFVHHETYQLMYGNRQQSEGQLCGPWDCTRQEKRLTFAGWEGFCAVLEDAGYWAVYFDVDGDMLRRRLPGKVVIEIELERRELKMKKPVFEEQMSAEDKLKEAQAEAETLAKVREAQAAAAAEAHERAREHARRQAEAQQKRNSLQQQQQKRQQRQARAKSPPTAQSPPATPRAQSEKGKQRQEQPKARSEDNQPRRRRRSKDKGGSGGGERAKSPQSEGGAPGPSSSSRPAKSPTKAKRRPEPLRSPSRAPSQTLSQASSRSHQSHRTDKTGEEGSISTRASTQRSRGRPQQRRSTSRVGGNAAAGRMKSPSSNPSTKARLRNWSSVASMNSLMREAEAPRMLGVREELDVSFPRLDELIQSLKYQRPTVEDSDESEEMPPSPDVD